MIVLVVVRLRNKPIKQRNDQITKDRLHMRNAWYQGCKWLELDVWHDWTSAGLPMYAVCGWNRLELIQFEFIETLNECDCKSFIPFHSYAKRSQ